MAYSLKFQTAHFACIQAVVTNLVELANGHKAPTSNVKTCAPDALESESVLVACYLLVVEMHM